MEGNQLFMNSNLTESQQRIVLQNKMIEMSTDLDRLMKTVVLGNGELPLTEKVRNLQKFADTINFWLRTVAVALVLQTITFFTVAVYYAVRLIPALETITGINP